MEILDNKLTQSKQMLSEVQGRELALAKQLEVQVSYIRTKLARSSASQGYLLPVPSAAKALNKKPSCFPQSSNAPPVNQDM